MKVYTAIANVLSAVCVNATATQTDSGVRITYEVDPETGIITDVIDIEEA